MKQPLLMMNCTLFNKPFTQTIAFAFCFIFLCTANTQAQEKEDTIPHTNARAATDSAIITDSLAQLQDTLPTNDTVPPVYYRINGKYFGAMAYDFVHVVKRPFHWKGKDWAKFAAVGAAVGGSMLFLDKPARKMILRNQSDNFDQASHLLYPLGNRFPPILLTSMYVAGVITHNRRWEHATLAVSKALVVSTAIYTSGKTLIRRQRPTRTDNPYLFAAPFNSRGFTSFPSGHANTVFSVATAFAMEFKNSKWVPWVAYTLASLTSVSRLYDDRHWLSDVILGASIGHFVTKTVYKLEEKRRKAGQINLKGIY